MATDEHPIPRPGREALTPAKQARFEKIFEHANKKTAGEVNYDYANELLTQCVAGHPANATYVQAFLDNLQKKYNNNRKGAPLAQFKERGARAAVKKALHGENWDEVVVQGLKVLAVNPWDVPTLTSMATAAKKMGDRDCELCYLKSALLGEPKDPELNRLFAIALNDRNLIDQAITFWHRVEENSADGSALREEARRVMAVLTVQKARSRGEFDDDETTRHLRIREQQKEEATMEQRLQQKIEQEPKNLAHYNELAQIYINDERYAEAEDVLAKAFEVSDGDAEIRDKWEDVQLRSLRQKIAQTKDPEKKKKLQQDYYEREIKVYQNRVEQYPTNLVFRYELGYRYMLTKQYNEAIRELQTAKVEPRRKGICLLALGQCFQYIKQYRLAMAHFEEAIQEIPDRDADNKRRALYLAGRLALGLKDLDAAEKHLATLAGLDFSYKDVAVLLDKIAKLRDNPESGNAGKTEPS